MEENQELSVEYGKLGTSSKHSICSWGRESGNVGKRWIYIWESSADGWYLMVFNGGESPMASRWPNLHWISQQHWTLVTTLFI